MYEDLFKEINATAAALIETWKITPEAALNIAVQEQKNRILAVAFGTHLTEDIPYLSKIAVALTGHHSIDYKNVPASLIEISGSIDNLARALEDKIKIEN